MTCVKLLYKLVTLTTATLCESKNIIFTISNFVLKLAVWIL